jgi:hypothetical protein
MSYRSSVESIPLSLQTVLEDIVSKIEIQPNFSISHPDYKPLELSAEALARFQQLPPELQHKYLSLQLSGLLYGIYYNGSLKTASASSEEEDEVTTEKQNLENNSFLGVDLEFYEQLHSSNKGKGYFEPGWSILREESDSSLAVTKDGLTLHVERSRHLQPEAQATTVGDVVAIRLPKNQVEKAFYIAIGDAGAYNNNNLNNPGNFVAIYFNLSAEGVVAVMDSLTGELNDLFVPFSFKVLNNPKSYPRCDSGRLYFDKKHYQVVRSVLEKVYSKHQEQFQAEVPLFTKLLAPGLALAEEPDCKFTDQESFGMNRCQIIANGLLEAWQQGDESSENRIKSILRHFLLLGIELPSLYLNANSKDIYSWEE